jgi:translation elongation factor EF-1beta
MEIEKNTSMKSMIISLPYKTFDEGFQGIELPEHTRICIRICKDTGKKTADWITSLYLVIGNFSTMESMITILPEDDEVFNDKIAAQVLSRIRNFTDLMDYETDNSPFIFGVINISQNIIDKYDELLGL